MYAVSLPRVAVSDDARDNLEAVRLDAVRLAAITLVALAIILNLAIVFSRDLPPRAWFVEPPLIVTAFLVHRALRTGLVPALACLVIGLTVVLLVAVFIFPELPLVCSLPLVVIFAGAFLGWRTGAVVAVGLSGVIAFLAVTPATLVSPELAATAVLLSWLNVIASWLISRPLQVALDWSWNSYMQTLNLLDVARIRQGELGQLSKSLAETCDRLEQMNRELEHARKSAEEARRLKSQFASAVSHELRTPLNLIIGFSEMMVTSPSSSLQNRLPDPYVEDVEAIYRNACHISALIDDILDLGQIDARRMGLRKEHVSLAKIVTQVVSSIGAQFENRGIRLEADVPADLPQLNVDPTRIRQVLINLLINALRFTDRGVISVRAERSVDGHEIEVRVTDTGVGIAHEDIPHVFDEFTQTGQAQRRRGGSGLGLTVTKRFVEMHGGSIWVESELAMGSSFHFTLPVLDNVVSSPYVSLPTSVTTLWNGNGVHQPVVVLDDDGESSKILERYLDDYTVIRAGTVEEALRICGELPVRAVVADTAELADVWQTRLGDQHVPQLPMITCSLHSARSVALEHGNILEYLYKPVTPERLRETLAAAARCSGARKGVWRIAIADDEPEMLRLLVRMVRSWSQRCQIKTASNGVECLALLRSWKADLLLLDLLMPDLDGYGVLEQVQLDARLRGLPVVLITAKGNQDEKTLASSVSATRSGGLSVAEAIRCVKSALDALVGGGCQECDPSDVKLTARELPAAPKGADSS